MPCKCALLAYLGLMQIGDGPARTLQVQIEDWETNAISRRSIHCEIAVAGNGSRANRCAVRTFRYLFFQAAASSEWTIYRRPRDEVFVVDEEARIVTGGPCGCTWETRLPPPGNFQCSQTVAALLHGETEIDGTAQILGQQVVRYRATDSRGYRTVLHLAPQLHCEVLEQTIMGFDRLGIPKSRWRYLVTDYRPGEPDPTVFTPPSFGSPDPPVPKQPVTSPSPTPARPANQRNHPAGRR